MKANEAPEIIYRTTTYLDNDKGKTVWKETPVKGAENIEYIRKDAFIEKACNWLLNHLRNYSTNALGAEYLIEDFKKYMEG